MCDRWDIRRINGISDIRKARRRLSRYPVKNLRLPIIRQCEQTFIGSIEPSQGDVPVLAERDDVALRNSDWFKGNLNIPPLTATGQVIFGQAVLTQVGEDTGKPIPVCR